MSRGAAVWVGGALWETEHSSFLSKLGSGRGGGRRGGRGCGAAVLLLMNSG